MALRAMTIGLMLLLVGCATTASDDALYRQLGGEAGVTAIASELIYRASGDVRVGHYWAGLDLDKNAASLAEQFCEVAGGPCRYSGPDMAEAHEGMGVDNGDFNVVVELLIDSMESLAVPQAAQNGLLARLAPMHGDIVR